MIGSESRNFGEALSSNWLEMNESLTYLAGLYTLNCIYVFFYRGAEIWEKCWEPRIDRKFYFVEYQFGLLFKSGHHHPLKYPALKVFCLTTLWPGSSVLVSSETSYIFHCISNWWDFLLDWDFSDFAANREISRHWKVSHCLIHKRLQTHSCENEK